MKRALSCMLMVGGLLLAAASSGLVQAQESSQKPDAKAGEQLYVNGDPGRGVLACVACHGVGGNSTIDANPSLAAMPHEYLVQQLHDFQSKDGQPPHRVGANGAPTVMTGMAAALSEQDIQNLALYLSQQPVDWDKAATAQNRDTIDRGQMIWRAGVADRRVPACAACHGANGQGVPGEFPRLAGQHAGYLLEQLKLFQSGDRPNAIMHAIADRLNDADLAAVADYAAGLR